MAPEPQIVVHAPLPRPADEDVGYEDAGEQQEPEPAGHEEKKTRALDPDPWKVLLVSPSQLFDPDEMARMVAEFNEQGSTRIHVALGESVSLNTELISGLRQLGVESGASRIDVHGHNGI
jgi:hypothetical protein